MPLECVWYNPILDGASHFLKVFEMVVDAIFMVLEKLHWLCGHALHLCEFQYPPYQTKREINNKTSYYGFCFDILEELSQSFKFR